MELQLAKELSSTQQNTAQNTATICPLLATKTALPRQYNHNKSTKNRNKEIVKTSTELTQTKLSAMDDNWLKWLDNPSPEDMAWLEALKKRDTEVGEVLREMHSLVSSKPHPLQVAGQTDESFWTGYARNCPGYELDKLKAELAKRKTANAVAISDLKA